MRRAVSVIAVLVVAGIVHALFVFACGVWLDQRETWVPFIYYFAIAGMLLFSLISFGVNETEEMTRVVSLIMFFQFAAVGAVILREPLHARYAEKLMLAVFAPSMITAFAIPGNAAKPLRFLRWAAYLALAGFPPLPGFFAKFEALSAMMHADLPWLAGWTAIAQGAVFIGIARMLLREMSEKQSDSKNIAPFLNSAGGVSEAEIG
jgi:hypothetical protein